MSNKSTKTGVKVPKVPRSMEEIQKAYSQLCAQAGQLQYSALQNNKQLTDINAQLERVNQEAAARQQLDKQSPPKIAEEPADTQEPQAASAKED